MADPIVTQDVPRRGFGLGPEGNAPLLPSSYDEALARQERNAKASASDLLGAMWRQDSITDGFMATLAGRNITPEPGYVPAKDPAWNDLKKDVQPEFVQYLDQATSPAHAQYLRERIIQKQRDLQMLADSGTGAGVARFLLGFANPENLVTGIAAGYVAKGAQFLKAADIARRTEQGIGRATAVAEAAAQTAGRQSTAGAIGIGTGFGAAENFAFEALRQSVNFEDDSSQRLEAALIGSAFTFPFALAGARQMARVSEAASRELEALRALKAAHEGQALTPEQGKIIADTHATAKAVSEFENGTISYDALEAKLLEIRKPLEMPEQWLRDMEAQLRQQADEIISTHFPGGKGAKPGDKAPTTYDKKKPVSPDTSASDAAIQAFNRDNPPPASLGGTHPVLKALLNEQRAGISAAHTTDMKWAAVDDALKAERHAAFQKAEAEDAARKSRDFEAAIRERELARMMLDGEDPQPAAKAPESVPADNAAESVPADKAAEPPAAPKAAPESLINTEVSWDDPKTGRIMTGTVERVNPDNGKLIVMDEDGNRRSVDPNVVDQMGTFTPPEGFNPRGSIGAAMPNHVMLGYIDPNSTALTHVTLPGTNGNVRVPIRFDIYRMFNESPVDGVRTMGHKLVKDPVRQRDGSAQDMTASEWAEHFRRTVVNGFHREAQAAFNEAWSAAGLPFWRKGEFRTWFYEAAGPVRRGDSSALANVNPAVAAKVKEVADSWGRMANTMLEEAQKAGVKGAADVPPNDLYLTRVWRHDKLREMRDLHGRDAVDQLVANAIKGPNQGDVGRAKRFLQVVTKLEFSHALNNIHFAGRDMATLRAELRAYRMSESDINTVIDTMFEKQDMAMGDKSQPARLKFRFDLDETVNVQTAKGTLKISDLLENDTRVLADLYGGGMAGHTGLAKVGIDSQAAWEEAIRTIEREVELDPSKVGPRMQRDMAWLEDVRSHILRRPMSMADHSVPGRAAAAFRGYTRSVMLGQLGITAAFELKQAVGLMGTRALFSQVPTFASFIKALRLGYFPDAGLARDVMIMGGWGQEKASAFARAREVDEGLAMDMLTRFERGANTVSHMTDVISGNASFTSLTKQLSAMMAVQRLHDHATGLKPANDAARLRMAGQGLEGQWADDTMAALQKYADVAGDRVVSIRHDQWKLEDIETYEKFQTYMSRQVRDSIQDQNIGETMPFMHSTLGKMFSELRTFFLVGHAKNMLKNLSYFDSSTFQIFMMGFVGEAMAYAMQQAINSPDKLNEKLAPDKLAIAVTSRMAALGFMPFLLHTGYSVATGGDSLEFPGMTTNTDSRNFLKTPSLTVAGRVMSAPATLMGLLTGSDVTTKKEMKDLLTTLPLSNTYALRAVVDYVSDHYPKSDPTKLPGQ